MQLCVMAQKRGKRKESVYIDTEGGFSTQRLNEIACGHFDKVPGDFLDLIRHTRCTDLVQLTSAVCRLQDLLEQNPEVICLFFSHVLFFTITPNSIRKNEWFGSHRIFTLLTKQFLNN